MGFLKRIKFSKTYHPYEIQLGLTIARDKNHPVCFVIGIGVLNWFLALYLTKSE